MLYKNRRSDPWLLRLNGSLWHYCYSHACYSLLRMTVKITQNLLDFKQPNYSEEKRTFT